MASVLTFLDQNWVHLAAGPRLSSLDGWDQRIVWIYGSAGVHVWPGCVTGPPVDCVAVYSLPSPGGASHSPQPWPCADRRIERETG